MAIGYPFYLSSLHVARDGDLFQLSDMRHLGRFLGWLKLWAGIVFSKLMGGNFGHLPRNDHLGDITRCKRNRSKNPDPTVAVSSE